MQEEVAPACCTSGNHLDGNGYRSLHPKQISMKRFINEELPKRSASRKNMSTVVARLMGVETMPPDEPINQDAKYQKNDDNQRIIRASMEVDLHEFYPIKATNEGKWDSDNQLSRREHPQEDELQKFKKEFEAWQATRFRRDQSSAFFRERNNGKLSVSPECSNEHKYETSRCLRDSDFAESMNSKFREIYLRRSNKVAIPKTKNNRRSQISITAKDEPNNIVILRPGYKYLESEESWSCSSGSSDDRGSIRELLEEVKDRLKCELLGNVTENRKLRDKKFNQKQLARHIAMQVKESVIRDLGLSYPRAESSRSFGSEFSLDQTSTRLFSERICSVWRRKPHADDPLRYEFEEEMQVKSFRKEDEASPRNLERSLSAPASGTSFGKLLLKDRNGMTGAHIRRKHEEAIRNVEKEKLSFKERVSNLRYFALKGKLFGKKMESETSGIPEKANQSPFSMNIEQRKIMENSTEVPPTPASLHEEFWKVSSLSTPDASPGEDVTISLAFADISSNLNDLRRQLNQLGAEDLQTTELEAPEPDILIHDKAELYIKDLLVASGLYHGSVTSLSLKQHELAKPLSVSVFDKVEVSIKGNADDAQTASPARKADRRLLFDLLNEVLVSMKEPKKIKCAVSKPPVGRKLLDCVWKVVYEYLYPPDGERSGTTLDGMVARIIETAPWLGFSLDEENWIAREVECQITADLLDEFLKDYFLRL